MVADPETDIAAIAGIAAVPTILDVVCRITGMGFAAVARVTEDRWIACQVRDQIQFGLKPGSELAVKTTICNEIRDSRQPVVIDHVAEDAAFRGHRTPAMYGFQSYISMPIIRKDGSFFGTLCAIDPRPARLTSPEIIGMFKLFADLIALHLDAQDRLQTSEAALLDERRTAELREHFIAVVGHDLRNPLAAIAAGTDLLLHKAVWDDKSASILVRIRRSAGRMAELIDNVLDFARGRLGGGLSVERTRQPLRATLEHVIDEMRTASPGRVIETRLALDRDVICDGGRIAQLLSNLLANALTHGAADRPVRVRSSTAAGAFELSVANAGEPIPAATIAYLFEPFTRAKNRPDQQGLGLGLYIAYEIARAHGGTLEVRSTSDETVFTFRMPLD